MTEAISVKRLKEIRNLVYNECSNYHFNSGCYNVVCEVKSHPHPSKQCCFLCEKSDCKRFRQCKFFDSVLIPLETRRNEKAKKEKEAKDKYREAIRKMQGIKDGEVGN